MEKRHTLATNNEISPSQRLDKSEAPDNPKQPKNAWNGKEKERFNDVISLTHGPTVRAHSIHYKNKSRLKTR